ncbi:MAG: site-specific integrase [Agriterribacter sp.]
MLQLPNNCRAGNFSYSPKNWNTSKANTKIPWLISYWFYDDNVNTRKRIKMKGMNRFTDLAQRQATVRIIVAKELELIKAGVNRISQEAWISTESTDLSEHTHFPIALDMAFKNLRVEKSTKDDIESCLKYLKLAINELEFTTIPISDIKRKHIKSILNRCGEIKLRKIEYYKKGGKPKPQWSDNTYNHYRKYLSVLFKELLENDAVDVNPVRDISKRKTIKKIRITLTMDERKKVDKFLREKHYNQWRFLHIFFHAGARLTEIMKLKKADVDLENQRYKSVVLKGRAGREIWRPIKNLALPLWKEVYYEAAADQFLFSKYLKPGDLAINPHQISRWWRKHVKIPMKIKADFYSLKHSNTTEIMDVLSAKEAATLNGHTSETMVINIYDVKRENRVNESIRKVNNPFV